ncbi:hypothetical protein [Spirosoma sordidisoli]|uniref:Uncharacterized protein n=1 Tax=Spirosoma sordidisoli TaxID=2502893 RepID=A0A4V1RWC3_9BACT|nr:hypothetical protein [Spirosoma sordidisoli]RYC69768.1 hypothetical protein EQG79_14325 [Spirosoma sordidisoli]
MKDIKFTPNPFGQTTTAERDAQFRAFNEELVALTQRYGYADYLITVNDARPPQLYSSAVMANTVKIGHELRQKSYRAVEDWVKTMSISKLK